MGVRLTPAGYLRWETEPDAESPAESDLGPVLEAFRTDWREALFLLAAEKIPAQGIPSLRFWQQLAEHYLTGLCHLPADAEQVAVEPPGVRLGCGRWPIPATSTARWHGRRRMPIAFCRACRNWSGAACRYGCPTGGASGHGRGSR